MKPGNSLRHHKWMTIAAVLVLLASTLAGVYAIWGVVFMYWGVLAIRSGQAFLVEAIERRETGMVSPSADKSEAGGSIYYLSNLGDSAEADRDP